MKDKNLVIMCGPAGSGKTTWVRANAEPGTSAHISRDRIRFNMVKEDEYYFSRENEVYMEFIRQLRKACNSEWVDTIYADATHLTKKSREKLIEEVTAICPWAEVSAVVILPKLEDCLKQNAQRQGRERVPDSVITNMYHSFQDPFKDDIEYKEINYTHNKEE